MRNFWKTRYLFRISPVIYPLDLKMAALLAGLLLLAGHLWAHFRAEPTKAFLRALPRSRVLGIALLAVAVLWTMILIYMVDLGEFNGFKKYLYVLVPVLGGLSIRFLDEFLAVRALGMLALLAAKPLLEAAYLRPEPAKLLVVILAYAWIFLGFFWVGMPYILRDQIDWVQKTSTRWRLAAGAGAAYGLILLVASFTV